jgi:hypothetical protein
VGGIDFGGKVAGADARALSCPVQEQEGIDVHGQSPPFAATPNSDTLRTQNRSIDRSDTKKPPKLLAKAANLVAGRGFEPATFRL